MPDPQVVVLRQRVGPPLIARRVSVPEPPSAREATLADHSCEHLWHCHVARWLDAGGMLAGVLSGRPPELLARSANRAGLTSLPARTVGRLACNAAIRETAGQTEV